MSAPYDEHISTHWDECHLQKNHHACALARLDEARARIARLEEAARFALNYITNTENELDITLESGNKLRAALGEVK